MLWHKSVQLDQFLAISKFVPTLLALYDNLIELETKTASTLTAFHPCSRTEHPLEGCWEHVQNNQENMIPYRGKSTN